MDTWHVIEAMELYIQDRICGLCDRANERPEGMDLNDENVSRGIGNTTQGRKWLPTYLQGKHYYKSDMNRRI